MEDLVRSKREQILRVAQRHGVTAVRVFGSMARGDAGPNSDVDLLVDVSPQPSAWFPGGLVADLAQLARIGETVSKRVSWPSRRHRAGRAGPRAVAPRSGSRDGPGCAA